MASQRFEHGQVIALRYVTADGSIEMCWPARVVNDGEAEVALFIAAGTRFRAPAKMTAAEKRAHGPAALVAAEQVWRNDALRLMFPGRSHSVLLFWNNSGAARRFAYYFVNLEEPFRRTSIGIDTRDHTLDVVVSPDLAWRWRDEDELASHVTHGFYTRELAAAIREEGLSVIDAIEDRTHPCLSRWPEWVPDPNWGVPSIPRGWDTTPPTLWDRGLWAYGGSGDQPVKP